MDPNAIVIYWKNGPMVLGRHPKITQNVSGLSVFFLFFFFKRDLPFLVSIARYESLGLNIIQQ